jgi:hypothetical protein
MPRRDPRHRKPILQLRRVHSSMKNWDSEIAAMTDCSTEHVRSVLKKNEITPCPRPPGPETAAQNPLWFVKAIETDLGGLRADLQGEPLDRLGREKPNTNLIDPSRVRPITQQKLEANTFPHALSIALYSTDPDVIKRGREWLRNHRSQWW